MQGSLNVYDIYGPQPPVSGGVASASSSQAASGAVSAVASNWPLKTFFALVGLLVVARIVIEKVGNG